jgi:hypothetical protein
MGVLPVTRSRQNLARKAARKISGLAALALVCLAAVARGAPQVSREYEIKAGFLYNFLKFIEWPEEPLAETQAPVTVCLVGADPFGEALDALNGKPVRGRPISIRRFQAPQGIERCRMVFVSVSEKDRLVEVLAPLERSRVLTVSDLDDFTQAGGMIQFVVEGNKVRFEINLDAAERVGLKVSSKLLNIARTVR